MFQRPIKLLAYAELSKSGIASRNSMMMLLYWAVRQLARHGA